MSNMSSAAPRPDKRRLRKATKRKSFTLHERLQRIASNFRFSLTFRISLHYAWKLLKTTLLVMLLITIALSAFTLADIDETVVRISVGAPVADAAFSQEVIQNSAVSQAYLRPDTAPREPLPLLSYSIVSLDAMQLTVHGQHASGTAFAMTYNLYRSVNIWGVIVAILLFCDLIRIITFICSRERLLNTVLAPIRDITELASTLSASNLSNRINIAGTKNELKDLAVVINSMLDRIERSYNSQKQFVSDASHELRTPIAVLQGYINMLKRWGKSDPEVLDEGINAIAQETQNMKELVESLLFLARHDKKTLMMEMERFDALDMLTELHREAAMVTPEDTFVLTATESCPMEGDRSMVKQIMRILCDNAVKYTPKGGVITLGIERTEGWVTLSVQDNGPGISQEDLPKIFERFYRADAARKSENGGHGLGLSIARIIVMAHGGKLRVRSKVGVGSTFYVDLPERQASLQSVRPADASQTT